jgi:nuclear cap-binding protein subunit 1
VNQELVSSIVKNIKRESRTNPLVVRSMLINCAVQLPAKVPIYSLIIGLINVDEPAFVAEILEQATSELNTALQNPKLFRKARLLLRFLTSLVVPGVVQPSSVVFALKTLVDVALNKAETSANNSGGDNITDTNGRTWQPYTDQLIYMSLMAVPFGGSELSAASGVALNDLVTAAESYLEKRPRSSQPGLRPFAASVSENDLLADSDNGGASFITEVVTAIKTMIESEAWHLEGIPRVHIDVEATLATAPQTHLITTPTVSPTPPVDIPENVSDTLAGALVLQAFPPRGIIRLLESKHTLGDRLEVERIIAEDYIIDTVAWFEGDRVECAKHLAGLLPIPYGYEPLLCEVMFSQMLRLPTPEFKPIMYCTLMVDLCKLLHTFPRAMSSCVRESFSRMNVMDPALRERLAEWLAYHLSNFEYLWPWAKWAHVLEAPAYDGQRRFCVAVMNRMVRLSYWDRVQAVVPEEFRCLLPPKPEVTSLPPPAGDDAGEEASKDLEGAWAAAALKFVRSKASAEEIESWVTKNKLEEVLNNGKIGVLRMWVRCLLVAGAKSYTHVIIALERYYGPLALLSTETGLEGQIAIVDATAQTWILNPQRAVMAVDRLMTLRLISAEAIISWVFKSDGVRKIQDQSRSGMAWEMLRKAVHKTIARVEDASEDLALGKAAIEAAKEGKGGDNAVAEAEAALPEKKAYLQETTSQQKGAVMQVLRCFADALAEGGFAGPDKEPEEAQDDGEGMALDAESTEGTILRDYIIASLRSFLREYHVQAAELEERIQEDILAMGSDEVREVVEVQLKM